MTSPLVVLVGCGAAKLARRARARDLYTGRLFKASLAYALALTDRVHIVSARHGLVDLDRELDPYNFTLADLGGKRQRENWGEFVVSALGLRYIGSPPRVTLLMGNDYARHLRGPILFRASPYYTGHRWPALAEEPLAGIRTIGLRVKELEMLTALVPPRQEGAAA